MVDEVPIVVYPCINLPLPDDIGLKLDSTFANLIIDDIRSERISNIEYFIS
jgi:hypothetical protein